MHALLQAWARGCIPLNNNLIAYLAKYLSPTVAEDKAHAIAEALVKKYGTLATIASSGADELMRIPGITESVALSIKLLTYVNSRALTDKFKTVRKYSEAEIEELVLGLFMGLSVETVYCLLFDKENRLIGIEYLGEGTVNSSEVYPRRVLECACKSGACGVIIAHNHPKGTPRPSNADLSGTEFLKNILSSAAVRLICHYLASDRECAKLR